MQKHSLKCWPPFFEQIKSGEKTFELRQNDRNFQVNDILELNEFYPETGKFTGDIITVTSQAFFTPVFTVLLGLKEGSA